MRSLIRPALFLVARLGLFLAVIAWGVSQWHVVNLRGHNLQLTCESKAWTFDSGPWWPEPFHVDVSSAFLKVALNDSQHWVEHYWGPCPYEPDVFWCGLCLYNAAEFHWKLPPARLHLIAHHWFIVAFFALFYGVLKWAYRKRGQTQVR